MAIALVRWSICLGSVGSGSSGRVLFPFFVKGLRHALSLACPESAGMLPGAKRGTPSNACPLVTFQVSNEHVAKNFVACWDCESGACKVFRDGGRVAKVVREKDGFGAEMGKVVGPYDGVVPVFRSRIAMGLLALPAEVSKKDDSRVFRMGVDKGLKLLHPNGVT